MAYSDTWNSAFEALPADTENISLGATKIRVYKLAIRERMQNDHYWDPAGTDADHGEHKQVNFHAPISTPGNIANKAFLYGKDISSKIELHYLDEDGNEVVLTKAGAAQAFPSGTKLSFYQDSAPTGWTIQNTLDDKLMFVSKGSVAGGETGGGEHSTGSWTISGLDHDHTTPNHQHEIPLGVDGSSLVWPTTPTFGVGTGFTYNNRAVIAQGGSSNYILTKDEGSGTTSSDSASDGSWRPASYVFIICEKD